MFFERYDKKVIEPFAITVVSKSFDSSYAEYSQPMNIDNFDFVSPDGLCAMEVVSVIPENEMEAYIYEKQLFKGKSNLNAGKIKNCKLREDGSLISYYGGSLGAIISSIQIAVNNKCKKARMRKAVDHYNTVDLCICVVDGSLMDLYSYKIANFDFDKSEFDSIFFITPSHFFRYSKISGFEEYLRVV